MINKIKREEIIIIFPEIILPEVSSAIARGTNDTQYALEFIEDMRNIAILVCIPGE